MTQPSLLLSYAFVMPGIHLAMYVGGNPDVLSQTGRAVTVILCTGTLVALGIRSRLMQRGQREPVDRFRVTVTEEQVNRWRHVDSLGQLAGAILLVEDEAGVRHVTSVYLRSKGYNVIEAQHAAEALRRPGGSEQFS